MARNVKRLEFATLADLTAAVKSAESQGFITLQGVGSKIPEGVRGVGKIKSFSLIQIIDGDGNKQQIAMYVCSVKLPDGKVLKGERIAEFSDTMKPAGHTAEVESFERTNQQGNKVRYARFCDDLAAPPMQPTPATQAADSDF